MKKLICEICNSEDLIKQNGVFTCQQCGTKYSVEEAKKMIGGESSTGVSTENAALLAKQYKEEKNYEKAKKYYEILLERDPKDWNAKFYCAYCDALSSTIAKALDATFRMEKVIEGVVATISEKLYGEERTNAVLLLNEDMDNLTYALFTGRSEDASEQTINLMLKWADLLSEQFSDDVKIIDAAVTVWKNAIDAITSTDKTGDIDSIVSKYENKIKKYDKDYVAPKSNITKHTDDSPNLVKAWIAKIGHNELTSFPGVPVPVNVMKPGTDDFGNIGCQVKLTNVEGKTLKRAVLVLAAYNGFGELVNCTIRDIPYAKIEIEGPLEVGKTSSAVEFEDLWCNKLISTVKIVSMEIEYMDGSKEKYSEEDLSQTADEKAQKRSDQNKSGAIAAIVAGVIILVITIAALLSS